MGTTTVEMRFRGKARQERDGWHLDFVVTLEPAADGHVRGTIGPCATYEQCVAEGHAEQARMQTALEAYLRDSGLTPRGPARVVDMLQTAGRA